MRALLAAALLAAQPETPTGVMHGVVLRHDGTAAGDARLDLPCGTWQQVITAGSDGGFAFAGVPERACVLVARAANDSSAGVSVDLAVPRAARISVILPAGIATSVPISGPSARPWFARAPGAPCFREP